MGKIHMLDWTLIAELGWLVLIVIIQNPSIVLSMMSIYQNWFFLLARTHLERLGVIGFWVIVIRICTCKRVILTLAICSTLLLVMKSMINEETHESWVRSITDKKLFELRIIEILDVGESLWSSIIFVIFKDLFLNLIDVIG